LRCIDSSLKAVASEVCAWSETQLKARRYSRRHKIVILINLSSLRCRLQIQDGRALSAEVRRLWEEPTEEIGLKSDSVGIHAACGVEDVKQGKLIVE
jgi:hypothetical protein